MPRKTASGRTGLVDATLTALYKYVTFGQLAQLVERATENR
jgi:hypothetical protein